MRTAPTYPRSADSSNGTNPRVLLVAESASQRFGGEAILPVHYFRFLRARGVDTRLLVHARTREELFDLFPADRNRLHFVPDTAAHILLHQLSGHLPQRVENVALGLPSRLLTQFAQRPIVRRLIRDFDIDVVHQPTPVSPRECSLLFNVGRPLVMGPLNGNMRYPDGFGSPGGFVETALVAAGRWISNSVNRLLPGKLQASTLLVANDRTHHALPAGVRGRVEHLCENSVDLAIWGAPTHKPTANRPIRFIFVGRLVGMKAADLLLEAFAQVLGGAPTGSVELHIVGDGPLKNDLAEQTRRLAMAHCVTFHGWQTQSQCAQLLRASDVFILPSLCECGGAAVLEAMACALPAIATAWGGPLDYLNDTCGILVEPRDREHFIAGLATAMRRLAGDPALRHAMGTAGRNRVLADFDWQVKIDQILATYREAIARGRYR